MVLTAPLMCQENWLGAVSPYSVVEKPWNCIQPSGFLQLAPYMIVHSTWQYTPWVLLSFLLVLPPEW